MDPISLAIGAVGLGMSIFGGAKSASDSSKYSAEEVANSQQQTQVSTDEAQQEQGINTLKQQQMQLDAQRQNLQTIRTEQQKQALGLSTATAQGAQFGSGAAGGRAATIDSGLFNMVGVNSALAIGTGISNYNQKITGDKVTMLGLQSQEASIKGSATSAMATDQGFTSLGGALMKAGPIIGQLSKGFGTPAGNYSGTPGASNTGGLY